MRNAELVQWNEFKDDFTSLTERISAGDKLSVLDIETIKLAEFYFRAVDEVADMPDIVRIYRNKMEP